MFQPGMCTFCLLLCGSLWASAQEIPARDSLALELALQQMEQHPALRSATWSFSLLDPGGTPVAMRRPEKTLAPASVLKLLSTAAALDQLGPGHRFPTRMAWSGRLEGGTLYGTLWLIGGGDPSLGSKRGGLPGLEAWLRPAARRAFGILKVRYWVMGVCMVSRQPRQVGVGTTWAITTHPCSTPFAWTKTAFPSATRPLSSRAGRRA